MKNRILIIGSGWLGASLASHLDKQGYDVKATTRQPTIAPQRLQINTDNDRDTIAKITDFAPQVMIIAISPNKNSDYLQALMILSKAAKAANVSRVVFIGSSSIWGNSMGLVNETTAIDPANDSAKAMAAFETHLQQQSTFEATTLRLCGLFNQQRHPGRFLAGREDVPNPNAVVNMIHQQDCVGLITNILRQASWQSVYIGCAPSHPTRIQFYTHGARLLNLMPPRFKGNEGHDSKKIDGKQSANALDYRYRYSDLMTALE